ncbi:TetR family transcriptional regulator [Nocardiopsis sp. CNR-923]|uniref:TetR/AcrR family transcriptional regulator n=1 Tax=Nocardiopsis sp. CNR-923 TaxID=1904965 RepID=UPI0009592123|nr:TetR/AcrR family transcriptional regulator [Nocardiopsis sp. CNR-923]OLT26048.1 TetR family transcriptional regulator [Nocardiopsis sp. CNR-923]
MARTADHGARRRQVAEALMRTVAERGLARTTLADVADEAGVSVGLVQRYFRAKSDLLRFGVEHMYRRAGERFQAVDMSGAFHDRVYRFAETLLPLDDERRVELTVWLEFLPATLTDPEMARLHQDTTRALVDAITHGFEDAVRDGDLPEGTDPRGEATRLVAFVDGLTLHHLVTTREFPEEEIRASLRAYLDRLRTAPGSPRPSDRAP